MDPIRSHPAVSLQKGVRVIRILADGANEQGDILTRLASDVFFTLGYADWQLNIQMTGRELDLVASHRYEPREVVAEFKSGAVPAGGADINKFVGALDAQRRRADGRSVQGYFVSLAGFRASALAQERELDEARVVLLDGRKVIEELIDGRIVVSPVRAIIAAQEIVRAPTLTPEEECDLIGHRLGWVWAVYFGSDDGRAVCLIHADGTPLPLPTAMEIAGTGSRNPFAGLRILNREGSVAPTEAIRRIYLSYLASEFGGLTLEGMPVDENVGSRRFNIESLYVPLKLIDAHAVAASAVDAEAVVGELAEEVAPASPFPSDLPQRAGRLNRDIGIGVGEAMERHRHLAVLGSPGSGKTTLLKRVAVAYADPERLTRSTDGLVKQQWLPVVVKCRQLGVQAARSPILSVIGDQADLAEMPELRDEFIDMVTRELRQGRLLLLVDGLDEIADPRDRARFVSQLRTFVGIYPTCQLIVTSRDAGFRSVAASVGAVCHPVRVADFSDEAIRSLVFAWHSEVAGNGERARTAAERLTAAIIGTDRLRSLAANPMLLTTLLLVQRWMGELPRRRSVLYDKAIEVLLTTWNIEGHEPLEKNEAIPQLAYTAFAMMTAGKTSVTLDELVGLLAEARRELPETLGYTRMPIHEFVNRVEDRSSLMTRTGHEFVNGKLMPIYEFRHLTFQEYLAAVAVTEGWLDARLRDQSVGAILGPHLTISRWQEIVVLSAVLGGRRASEIVTRLIDKIRFELRDPEDGRVDFNDPHIEQGPSLERADVLRINLLGCLRDEASLAPELARIAIESCVGTWQKRLIHGVSFGRALHGGRYDRLARDVAFAHLDPADPFFYAFTSVLGEFGFRDRDRERDGTTTDDWIAARLSRDDDESIFLALATLKFVSGFPLRFTCERSIRMIVEHLLRRPIRQDARTMLSVGVLSSVSTRFPSMPVPVVNELQVRLVQLWMASGDLVFTRSVLWALTSTPLIGSWNLDEAEKMRYLAFAVRQADETGRNRDERRQGSLVIRRYVQSHETWPAMVGEVSAQIGPELEAEDSFVLRLLDSLGNEGRAQLRRLRPGVYDDPWEALLPPISGLDNGA